MKKLRFIPGLLAFAAAALLLAIGIAATPPRPAASRQQSEAHPSIPAQPAQGKQALGPQQAALLDALMNRANHPAKGRTSHRMAGARAKSLHRVPKDQNSLLAKLGKDIFFDTNLSNPRGMSCATCHAPAVAFTYPESDVNQRLGVAPGIVPGRFEHRKVPTISYSAYCPTGPFILQDDDNDSVEYVGGFFWDGRAADLVAQVPVPLLNPDEMNNVVHDMASPDLVVEHVSHAPYAGLFRRVYGRKVFSLPVSQVMGLIAQAVEAYEDTPEVSPFSSKYDAYLLGRARLSASEMNGLRLVTGTTNGRPDGPPFTKNAQCVQCHGIPDGPATADSDLWTLFCYVNIGVPKNPSNPYYTMTDAKSNPLGYNPLGAAYIDLGLGDFYYPTLNLPPGNMGPQGNGKGDFLAINGTFKAPTLRNVDKRPSAGFVKAYMHNGAFKSLEQVVHFYNTRNLTTYPGEVIDFTRANPYSGLKGRPLWPPPEFPSTVTLQNPSGRPGSINAQVGNLGLTAEEEADIVAFLGTLSDGYMQR